MCDWGGGPNQITNYIRDETGKSPVERAQEATAEARRFMMDKKAKSPIPETDKKKKEPVFTKGTAEPTTKK